MEEDRIESAAAPPPQQRSGCLIAALFGFVFLLPGVGGGGCAALYFTGALASRERQRPEAAPKPPDDSTPRGLLLGRWELKLGGGAAPPLFTGFHDDGTLVTGGSGQEMKGTWKLVDDSTLEATLDVPGKAPMKRLLKIQVDKDQLTATDEQKQSDVFQRTAH